MMTCPSALADSVKGFLDPAEGEELYRLAQIASGQGPCLEIGGYCGKSTVYLGTACRENRQILYSIDHHTGSEEHQPGEAYHDPALFDSRMGRMNSFPEFRKTLSRAKLEDTVVPLVCRSDMAARYWRTPLALVFIDGGHSPKSVFTDYGLWSPHLFSGGYLLMHDVFENPDQGGQGPYEVYQTALASGMFHPLSMIKTLGILQKIA